MADMITDNRMILAQQTLGTPPTKKSEPQETHAAPAAEHETAEPHDEVHLSPGAEQHVQGEHHDGKDEHEGNAFTDATKGAKLTQKAGHIAHELGELRGALVEGAALEEAQQAHAQAETTSAPEAQRPAPAAQTPRQQPAAPAPAEAGPALKEPHSDDMRQMVDDLRRNGAIPERPAPPPALKEPISEDMRNYVEAVRGARNEEQAAATAARVTTEASGAANAATVTEEAGHAAHAGHSLSTGMRVFDGVLGPIAAAGSAYHAYEGAEEFAHGKKLDGTLDMVAGAGGTVAGLASTGTAITGTTGTVVAGAALGTIATVGGGVFAAADGVKDIVHGVKEKDWEKGGVGVAKTVAGGMMLTGAAMGPAGAPLVIAGGITYLGAAAYEHREDIKHAAQWVGGKVSSGVSATVQAGKDVAHRVSTAVSEKAAAIKQRTGELIDAGKQKAAAALETGKQVATQVYHRVSEKASEVKQAVSGAVHSATSTVSHAASGAWNWAKSGL